ncbi:hypothetical protein GCM10010964_24780 [Caldovatus sediminis]|uniref:Uncharacterized protein n=1 Tax=Caldovatus sediminis TaxID=2041189 RepID=A0A8J2ZCC9_9PROT|nr:hypothetical protein GCM10010964_24780 [Caldovatus sediminis]
MRPADGRPSETAGTENERGTPSQSELDHDATPGPFLPFRSGTRTGAPSDGPRYMGPFRGRTKDRRASSQRLIG